MEIGETLEQAVIREVKEETNLGVNGVEFLMFQEFIHGDEFYKPKHFIFFDFRCRTNSTEVVLNDEGTEYVWVTVEQALEMPIASATKSILLRNSTLK